MTRPRRKQSTVQKKSSRPVSRRLRQKTRLDYKENSDTSSSLQLISDVFSATSSSEEETSSEYEVRAILQSRQNIHNQVEYLIDWANHPTTGQRYSPTWEPRENLDSSLETAWLQQQHERDSESNPQDDLSCDNPQPLVSDTISQPSRSPANQFDVRKAAQSTSPPKRPKQFGSRQRRVVESSSSQVLSASINPASSPRKKHQPSPQSSLSSNPDPIRTSASDEAEVRAFPSQENSSNNSQQRHLHLQKKLSASSSLLSTSIDHSAQYQPGPSAESQQSLFRTSVIVHSHHQLDDQSISQQSGDNIAWSSRRDEAQFLVPRSSLNPFRLTFQTPRRFSPTAVIPDSQASNIQSVHNQTISSHSSGAFHLRHTINQVFDDSISSSGHIQLHTSRIGLNPSDPIIPETQSQGVSASDLRSLSSPWPLAQSPLLEASLKQASNSHISQSLDSAYLASSEDEGFCGSDPDHSFLENSIAVESLPNAQRFEFSSTESVDVESSQNSLSEDFRRLPQSTHPNAIGSPRQDPNNALANNSAGLSQSMPQPQINLESSAGASIPVKANMRSGRGRSGVSSQTEEGESAAPRKSLRGMRKEVETQRAQMKARTQKSNDQDESKQRSPDSETQSSTGAAKGRGRKKKDGEPSSLGAENVNKSNGASTNLDITVKFASQSALGPKLPNMQFIVPMPLVPQAGDQYRRTVVYNKVLIESFTATDTPSADLIKQAGEFVQTMRNICMHLDLANEEESLSDVLPSQQMTWDRSISSKFQLMGILLEQLQDHDLNIVIFASPGKVIDMVEKFVTGYDLNLLRPDLEVKVASTQAQRQLKITLLPSKGYDLTTMNISADLIIALDHGIDVHQPQIRAMRAKENRLAPVLFLVVLNSIDHVDKVMASSWKGTPRLRTEIACLAKLRADAGRFNGEFQSVSEVGTLIAEFVINSGAESDWPVAPIGPLADNESWDLATGQTILVNQESDAGRKRSRDSSVDEARFSKKAKTINNSLDIEDEPSPDTEMSDSRISESELAQQLSDQSGNYVKVQEKLKAQLVELKATMKKKDAHVRNLGRDFDKQMNRFEGQNKELATLRRELEEANKNIASIKELRIRRDETIESLREENNALKMQLQEASKTLESSAVPEIAELARLRREKAEAEAAAVSARKQAESAQNLTGYLQENYRTASDRAVEAIEQNEMLEAKVKELERKAGGEAVRLQQATSETKQSMTTTELKRLRVELKNTKAVLAKKEDELKAKRGGIGTRAGSVPRSPRVGPSSRATSPIPDRRIETLRNNTFTGRGKAKNPRKVLDAEDASRANPKKKEGPATPKGSGRPEVIGEPAKDVDQTTADVTMTDAGGDPKLPDIQPAQPTQAPVVEGKNGPPTSRPFPCCFAQYNCNASFTSKNEWKRHISTKHIQIGFWRCDMCNPSPGLDHPVYNDFNRKDLFTQHLRRMHAPNASSGQNTPNPQNPGTPIINVKEPTDGSAPSGSQPVLGTLSEEQITEIQKRCFKTLRAPPHISSCVFCSRVFTGPASWEERLEHVGGHMERDRKNGTNCLDIAAWKEDSDLRDYLVTEGIVEQDQRGNWRIGDGRPRRPLTLDMPSTPGTLPPGATLTFGSNTGDGSDEAMSKRRRGRPPKTFPDAEDSRRLGLGTPGQNLQVGTQDSRHRSEQTPSQMGTPQAQNHVAGPSPHPTSEMRGPSMQPRNDSAPATPITSGPTSQRLDPFSQQHFLTHHSHTMPQSAYARESSPPPQRPTGLPHIMPRTPQTGHNPGHHMNPFGGPSSHQGNGPAPIAIAPAYHQHQQMHALAPAPSRVPMLPDSNQHPTPINQLLAQQMAKAAMDAPSSGPTRASHSPMTHGSPYYPPSAGPTGYAAHSQEAQSFSSSAHQSQNQNVSAIAEPTPTNSAAPNFNGLLSPSMQSQIHPDFLDNGLERPPSTGDNRAKSFREVMGIEKDAASEK